MKSGESLPSAFLTCNLSPFRIFLPDFFAINWVVGFCSSFIVFCASPFSRRTAHTSKRSPVILNLIPVTLIRVILGSAGGRRRNERRIDPPGKVMGCFTPSLGEDSPQIEPKSWACYNEAIQNRFDASALSNIIASPNSSS